MNAKELKTALTGCPSLRDCEALLAGNAHDIRRLFYGPPEIDIDLEMFDVEEAFLAFVNSPCAEEMRCEGTAPPQVLGLLILFMSFFERAGRGFIHVINRIARLAPDLSLRSRATALFQYRNITRAGEDYTARSTKILSALSEAWGVDATHVRQQSEDMLVEYYCAAAAAPGDVGAANRTALFRLFTTPATIKRYPILSAPRISALLSLPPDRLGNEQGEASLRIAEGLYDEATQYLPEPRGPPPPASVCAHTGVDHGGHCPPGLHQAKVAIAQQYPDEFAKTHFFVGQSLNSRLYTSFDSALECMRYFRQYMPLHMPQIETGVLATFENGGFHRQRVHVLDVGGGPGNLYCILAGLLYRDMLPNYEFEVSLVEPARPFHDFLDIITANVQHPRLRLRAKYNCRLDEVRAQIPRPDVDWFFVANTVTPLIAHVGNVPAAVDSFCAVVASTMRRHEMAVITIAENSDSVEFPEFCSELRKRGLSLDISDRNCSGPWLAGCQFYVTGSLRPTRPRLRLALAAMPEGAIAP